MKIKNTVLIAAGLLISSVAGASSALYEVEVTGLQGLSINEGATVWQPAPTYPSLALRRRVEGSVLVEYSINAHGQAENIVVLESSPRGFFDNSTIRALEGSTFGVSYLQGEPAKVDSIKKRFVYKIEYADGDSNNLQASVSQY